MAPRAAPVFALLDGNNFYAACERVFDPQLMGRPLVVLSNNDGCAIARSEEAKALGIRMGAPWFQIRHLAHEAGLIALSANFELYGDMSQRMMTMAETLGCGQEVYSIDECFLDMTGIPGATERARQKQAEILQGIGIPTCIGIGPSKTLAKLANHIAKMADRKPGLYPPALGRVCNLAEMTERQRNALLQRTDVGEVWGVGRRIADQLQAGGVRTVLDLKRLDPATARRSGSVVLERTVRELNGVACLKLEDEPAPKQEIACTRSFGAAVTELAELNEAVSTFASRAARKLRAQGSEAHAVLVFIRTSPFRPQDRQYSRSITVPLGWPSADTLRIANAALQGLKRLFRPGYRYAKAGVMLLDLQAAGLQQQALALGGDDAQREQRNSRLMRAMDAIQHRFGPDAIRLGATLPALCREGAGRWQMKQERRSPRYTTDWADLMVVG
jgi:DNA polymerase V